MSIEIEIFHLSFTKLSHCGIIVITTGVSFMKYYPYVPQQMLHVSSIYTIYHRAFQPDFFFDGETHDFWELVYVESGKVGITADERVFELSAGQVVFHKPMEFHRIWSAGGTAPCVFVITFSSDSETMALFHELATTLSESSRTFMDLLIQYGQHFFVQYIYTDTCCHPIPNESRTEETGQMIQNLLQLFLLSIIQTAPLSMSIPLNRSSSAQLYQNAVHFLQQNIGAAITTDEICRHCSCSLSNLKKVFRKYTGAGVMKYYSRLKIERAALLIEKGYSMNEIADLLAFSSQHYFTVAFKRETGLTPSAFRKRCGL